MPFCIVLTKEDSSHLICFVPRTWVKDSILYWPRLKKKSDLELLRRDDKSVPAQNWKKIMCKIKVDGIETVSEALKLEELYSKFEDTEDEERYHRNRENHRKHPYLKAVTDDLLDLNEDFNLIAEEQEITMHGMADKETVGEVTEKSNLEEEYDTKTYSLHDDITFESNQAQNITETIEKNVMINTDSAPQNNVEELVTLKLDNFNELMSENSTLSAENKILKESIQRFQNLEQETKRGFAVMQIQLDKIFDLLTSKTNNVTVNEIKQTENCLDQKKIDFPVKSVEQLDLLEKELSQVDFEKAVVQKFSKITGTSGTHKIGKIGLQISKAFFTDELLSKFSWKGIKGSSKPPFMPYINIRNCFYKIAHLADDSCTTLEVDLFLQNSAIKHSSQRLKRKSSEEIIAKSKKNKNETILNKEENEMDDNTPDIKASKLVTVLSNVVIKNKDIDSMIKSKAVNISSDDLSNSDLFD